MNTKEIRELSDTHLKARSRELEAEYYVLGQAVKSGKEKDHTCLKRLRRDIARLKTVLREKESGRKSSK